MKNVEKLERLIKEQHGTVLSSDLTRYDIPRTYLSMMVAEGKLERMDRGIYASIDSIEDQMYAMQRKYPKLIFSHETALFVHGLTDRTPFEYTATVPSGYKVVESLAKKFKVYYIKKELYALGLCEVKSSFGNPIMTYDVERTICDIVRSRSRIDIQIFNDALKRFVNKKSVDYSLLMIYAKKFKVEKKLREYLEILL
jgi:predicted transcriptional regulator of viral defense system